MTGKKVPFELNEAMLGELTAERRGAEMVAMAQVEMIINLFGSNVTNLIPGDTGFGAILATIEALNS